MTGFDLDGFCKAIREVTTVYRKGEAVERRRSGNLDVVEVFGYPHATEAEPTGGTMVDLVFVMVEVHPDAKDRAEEFMAYLKAWHSPTLADGPSYIHTGAELGDQELALRLFAILDVLGWAKVATPGIFGADDKEMLQMAGRGLLFSLPEREFAEAVRP